MNSIIRRFDVTADARISFGEFLEGITPFTAPGPSLPADPYFEPKYNNLRGNHQIPPSRINQARIEDVRASYTAPTRNREFAERPAYPPTYHHEDAKIPEISPSRYSSYQPAYNTSPRVQASQRNFYEKPSYLRPEESKYSGYETQPAPCCDDPM